MDTVPYTLVRSNRKSLGIQVARDLSVVVRAPHRMSRQEIDRAVAAHAKWIETNLAKARARLVARPALSDPEIEALKQRAKALLPDRVAYYARRMGLAPTGVKITSATTRFGSCNAKNSLCFSYHLMRYPMEAIDYVVVHELAHITHKHHGPAFHALVAQVLPDHLARRALLRG